MLIAEVSSNLRLQLERTLQRDFENCQKHLDFEIKLPRATTQLLHILEKCLRAQFQALHHRQVGK